MKRVSILGVVLVAALALGMVVSGALLAQQDSSKVQVQERTTLQQQARSNSQGSAAGRPAFAGRNFVDENGNGICDRFEQGQAFGPRGNRGTGQGANFVDEDGDGICDHYAAGGRHMGRSQHGHSGSGMGTMARGCRRAR
jgi:hypothetical protein